MLLRDLARSGRMARLRIALQDRPGALAGVDAACSTTHQVNIVEIYHQRVFTSLPAKDAAIEVDCEARDAAQLDASDRSAAGRRTSSPSRVPIE